MIRLTHLSGSQRGTSSTSPKAVVRMGRGNDCDVRFDPNIDTKVSTHHAEIRFEDGNYFLIDVGSTNGTLVNGKRVSRTRLRNGDKFHLGGEAGPEIRFEIDATFPGMAGNGGHGASQGYGGQPQYAPQYAPPPQPRKPAPADDKDVKQVAQEAQAKIAMARAMSGSASSGQTMFIMAESLQKVEETTHTKD